jgi:Heat induced stress protein YflT
MAVAKSTTTTRNTAVGVFETAGSAQAALHELRAAGFREDQIGVVSPGHDKADGKKTKETGTHVAEGAGIGVAAGAGVGALWALGIMAGFLPAIGPVVAGGIFASILASAAGGAAIAGIAGALVGLGIPEAEATYYEGEVKSGRTLVTVKTEGRYDEAYTILRRHSAYDHQNRTAGAAHQMAGAR